MSCVEEVAQYWGGQSLNSSVFWGALPVARQGVIITGGKNGVLLVVILRLGGAGTH